jgi:hypothetical protein
MGYALCYRRPAIILATNSFEYSGPDNETEREAESKTIKEEYAVAGQDRS